ncbi:MAG: hypothetical protein ACK5O2_00895 [Microthrixaceae bacterium]
MRAHSGYGIHQSLDVLDSAADLDWIVSSDGLEGVADQIWVGRIGETSEIVGVADDVKFSLLLFDSIDDDQLRDVASTIRFRPVGR